MGINSATTRKHQAPWKVSYAARNSVVSSHTSTWFLTQSKVQVFLLFTWNSLADLLDFRRFHVAFAFTHQRSASFLRYSSNSISKSVHTLRPRTLKSPSWAFRSFRAAWVCALTRSDPWQRQLKRSLSSSQDNTALSRQLLIHRPCKGS